MDEKKLKSHLFTAGYIDDLEVYDSPYFEPAETYYNEVKKVEVIIGSVITVRAERFDGKVETTPIMGGSYRQFCAAAYPGIKPKIIQEE